MKMGAILMLAAITAFLTGCDAIKTSAVKSVSAGESPSERKSYFDRKRQCAEAGLQFFERSRRHAVEFPGKLANSEIFNGPYFAYSPDRDTCLIAWETTFTSHSPDGRAFTTEAGVLQDVFTSEFLADYGVSKDHGVVKQSWGAMSEDQYKAKRKKLMGF